MQCATQQKNGFVTWRQRQGTPAACRTPSGSPPRAANRIQTNAAIQPVGFNVTRTRAQRTTTRHLEQVAAPGDHFLHFVVVGLGHALLSAVLLALLRRKERVETSGSARTHACVRAHAHSITCQKNHARTRTFSNSFRKNWKRSCTPNSNLCCCAAFTWRGGHARCVMRDA